MTEHKFKDLSEREVKQLLIQIGMMATKTMTLTVFIPEDNVAFCGLRREWVALADDLTLYAREQFNAEVATLSEINERLNQQDITNFNINECRCGKHDIEEALTKGDIPNDLSTLE